jgi:hypothetical protein
MRRSSLPPAAPLALLLTMWVGPGVAAAQGLPFLSRSSPDQWERVRAAAHVPLAQLPDNVRHKMKPVLERPTLYCHSPGETFTCHPPLYFWLLDHPERAVPFWQRLGATCLPITPQGNGRFGWSDGQGSEVHWDTVYHTEQVRVWYAEGNVRPGPLMPLVPVRAVVVLRHDVGKNESGAANVRHQGDLFLYTDSRAAALVTRLLGPQAPRLAEQGLSQLELFFSGPAWYLQQHPERAETMMRPLGDRRGGTMK